MLAVIETWRDEIEAELADAVAELAEAEAAAEAAGETSRAARLERAALRAALAPLGDQMVSGVSFRWQARNQELARAAGAVTGAQLAVETLRRRVDDLEAALSQLRKITPEPGKAADEPALEAVDA